jgi:PPOX class probable F420-dependent enzyme
MSELTMTKASREAFLADLHVGVVTATRAGGAPLAAPVWYAYQPGGDVVFVFPSDSEKLELVAASGTASLCVQTESVPYKYVTVDGPAIVGDPDEEIERALAHRYLGPEIGDLYLRAIDGTTSRVVRLTPTRWRTVDYTPFVERVLGSLP